MINERKLTPVELKKREDIIMNMKGNKRDLVKKYGKDAEAVMYGRATNMAKKQTENMRDSKLTELIKDALKNPKKADLNKDGELSSYEKTRGAAIEKSIDEDQDLESGAYGDPVDAELDITTAPQDHTEEESELGLEEYMETESYAADYEDIAQAYMYAHQYGRLLKRMKNWQLEKLGKKIVDEKYDGDIGKAYDEIVKSDYKPKLKEDIDIGHEDDEPGMLQGDLYQIGKSAMEIYELLDAMEGEGEVDLPSWWQSKIYKAKEAIVGASEYLEFELKEPAIDAVVDTVAPLDINVEPSVDVEIDETVEDYITSVDDLTEKNMKEQSNSGSNYGSNENSNKKSNTNPESYSGLKKFVAEKLARRLKEDKDWIQKAIKRPGALHRALGIPQDKDIPDSLIDKDIRKMDKEEDKEGKLDKKDLRFLRQLDLAKTLEKFDENVTENVSENEYFSYLNDLRDSGQTNMFGAGEYLERDFNLDKREAREILTRWMRSFDENIDEGLPKGYWDKKIDAKDEDQDGKVDESYDTLVNKIKKSGKSEKAAKAIAGAVASYKAKGGGKGPTSKQK